MSDCRIKEVGGQYIIQQSYSQPDDDYVTWSDTSAGPIVTNCIVFNTINTICLVCKRTGELTSRNLCEECDCKIPDYIPEDQYNQYMRKVWSKNE